jgi:DNA-directed RNA polymerase subunit RPC12/RpoP
MDRVTEVQLKLQKVGCPQCFNTRLDLVLRCDLGQDGCIYTAKCLHCGSVFEVNTKSKTVGELEPELEKKMRESGCPKCGGHDLQVDFRCDLASQNCFHVLTCETCGHVFMEGERGAGDG